METATNIERTIKKSNTKDDYIRGLKLGIPIALGYIPVSFTFGIVAVKGGIPVWVAILISLTNLTSAGQFAGTNLIICGAPIFEIALATFIINIRYSLMSLSLSQRLVENVPVIHKCLWGFGITDETFTVASMENCKITSSYMAGLITLPYIGWGLGTAVGAISCSMLPPMLQNAMGIALYAMFIALLIPSCKQSIGASIVCGLAIGISCMIKWVPMINNLSTGWSIIISTIIACTAGALLFPRGEED